MTLARETGIISAPISVVEGFAKHFVVDDKTDCWNWTLSTFKGYGGYSINHRTIRVHRAMYELVTGKPILSHLVVDHLCRNKKCLNPKHLEVVTNKENVLRGVGISAVNARKTHCMRGHEFTPENTRVRKSTGTKECRKCLYIRDRNRKAKGYRPQVHTKPSCIRGHLYTPENSYINPSIGDRHCRICVRDSGIRMRAARKAALKQGPNHAK